MFVTGGAAMDREVSRGCDKCCVECSGGCHVAAEEGRRRADAGVGQEEAREEGGGGGGGGGVEGGGADDAAHGSELRGGGRGGLEVKGAIGLDAASID